MNNKELIEKFYTAFSSGNAEEMISCYHEDVLFKDPAFGTLKGNDVFNMWRMLLSKKSNTTKITFTNITTEGNKGAVNWTAKYLYGNKNRKVVNNITANFTFKNGKIIKHIDTFNLWNWSRQALGFTGLLLGWTPFMKTKIQKTTRKKLDNFISKK